MTIEPNGRTREQNLFRMKLASDALRHLSESLDREPTDSEIATLAGLNRNFVVRSRQAIEERLHGRPGDDE